MELQTGELRTRLDGWLMVELMFLPIMARATHVQGERERECSCLTYVYSHVVVHNILTSKPDVFRQRHCNTVDLP